MIEKVMRAVKSSNKKRGRNITIGAVVGMLLSCTSVMGAEGDYLWIKNDSGTIEFSKDDGTKWEDGNPYPDNSWNGKTYINNIALSGTDNGKNESNRTIGYGLKLSGNLGKNFNLVNNGVISGTGITWTNSGYGVYLLNSTLRDIGNNGIISGSGYGVYLYNTTLGDIGNAGIISGTGTNYSSGVYLTSNSSSSTVVESMVNTGIISGTIGSVSAYGIALYSGLIDATTSNTTMKSIGNNGIISGSGSYGYGVNLYSNSSSNTIVESIVNKGIIYGTTNAIYNNGGKITKAHNYGLLVSGTGETVLNTSLTINNGLIFKADGGTYTATSDDFKEFGKTYNDIYAVMGYEKKEDGSGELDFTKPIREKYTIINAEAKGTSETNNIYTLNGTNSISTAGLSSNVSYILNGIKDTLLVSTGDNRLNNSVINAYGNAVKFDETNGGELTLTGTVVNGGIKGGTVAVKGSDKVDTLTLQGKTVINGNINLGAGANIIEAGEGTNINGNISAGEGDDTFTLRNNVFINGNINTGGGADTLNIGNGVQINGTLDGGTDSNKDTLNFGVASSSEEIRVLHNISNFENINVGTNVTFYENTIDNDGKMVDLKITGVENLTIGTNGVLTLRIDSTKKSGNKIRGHALYDSGTAISSTGGKLVLALNGAVENNIIDFGTTGLDMSTFVTREEGTYKEDVTLDTTSALHSVKAYYVNRLSDTLINQVIVTAKADLPMYNLIPEYEKLNEIYHGILSVEGLLGNFNVEKDEDEDMSLFLSYLNDIYAGNPYSYSSELSRKSTGMFRDIVTENQFRPNLNNWLIYGGLTHIDGGTKDTYYGKGYYTYDIGSSDIETDTKITGAYILGEYGVSETLTSGVIIGGNKLKSDLSNGSKVDGDALYLGAYAKKYVGNLKVTAGLGFQYGDYDVDRLAVNKVASETGESVVKYSSNYNDMTYDIYLNGRYSNPIGENLFLEPYGTLSYTYIKQDAANEGSKVLAIETDSKSFDYTVGKVGLDLKKVIAHSNGKSTLTAGVSYTKILDGAEEEHITGRFKGGSDFDILVAHKNQHSIGLNAKYALELESGVLFDVKGTYSIERDSHNNSGKNKTKGEWIVGAGLGYKF